MKLRIIETTNIHEQRIWIVSKSSNWRSQDDNVVFYTKKEAKDFVASN
jgi:hypothetical protein